MWKRKGPLCHSRAAAQDYIPESKHLPSSGILLSWSSEVGPETVRTSAQQPRRETSVQRERCVWTFSTPSGGIRFLPPPLCNRSTDISISCCDSLLINHILFEYILSSSCKIDTGNTPTFFFGNYLKSFWRPSPLNGRIHMRSIWPWEFVTPGTEPKTQRKLPKTYISLTSFFLWVMGSNMNTQFSSIGLKWVKWD